MSKKTKGKYSVNSLPYRYKRTEAGFEKEQNEQKRKGKGI